MRVLGALSLIGTAVSVLLALLNMLFDWLETVIRDARGRICGKGLPSLPDWDPTGWEPPIMTVVGDAVSLEISRALVPEARQRLEVTDAVAAAATNLVAQYRASQSALGSAMGTAVGQHA